MSRKEKPRAHRTVTIRIEASTLKAAKARAAATDDTLSRVIRAALRAYVGGGK